MMLRDTLHLERVLLGMMRGEYLVEDDDGAVSIASGEYEALAIRGPAGREDVSQSTRGRSETQGEEAKHKGEEAKHNWEEAK